MMLRNIEGHSPALLNSNVNNASKGSPRSLCGNRAVQLDQSQIPPLILFRLARLFPGAQAWLHRWQGTVTGVSG